MELGKNRWEKAMTRIRIEVVALMLSLGSVGANAQPTPQVSRDFVGSAACGTCHQEIYDRWGTTAMANVVVDPAVRPGAVLGDFSTPNSLVTFDLDDIAFTYGSKWKQRYFTRLGDDFYVQPAQWDVVNEVWRPYSAGRDWWVEHYPADHTQRPTGPLCDGCHATNYDVETKQVSEWNVGCEKCHGAGGLHVTNPVSSTIVNPARLDFVRGNDICIQCHSQGRPIQTPLNGVYYDWPVGFEPGDRLRDYWILEEHRLGEETFTHWPEGSAHKNRMQGNDFITSSMYTKGVDCWSCHDVHGTQNDAELIRPANQLCLGCHGPESSAGPRGALEQHTHHLQQSAGSECIACHMPRIVNQIADFRISSHTFRFMSPAVSEAYGIPNACTSCHADRTNEWAASELAAWETVSPWRVGQPLFETVNP